MRTKYAALLLAAAGFVAGAKTSLAAQTYAVQSGSSLRLEGTSNIFEWQLISRQLDGTLKLDEELLQPMATKESYSARGDISVPLISLHSIDNDGKEYDYSMNRVARERAKADLFPKIVFHLEKVTAESDSDKVHEPLREEAVGTLTVAGVTNSVRIPVKVSRRQTGGLLVAGTTKVNLTDYKIQPPVMGSKATDEIKTGDALTVRLELNLSPTN